MPTEEIDEVHIASLIALVGLPFSKKRNALFGPFHVAAIIAYMVRNNICANAAIAAIWADMRKDPRKEIKLKSKRKVRFPTDQWLFRLFGSMSPEEIEERCDLMLDAQMRVARGAGMMNEAVIDIIDIHNIQHYGKTKDKHIVRAKSKDGTSKAESYATLLTTSGNYPMCTAATRVRAKRTKGDMVGKLLDDRARRRIRSVITMLDRGFFSVAVMKAFKTGQHFVMGAVRTPAVKKALAEYVAGDRNSVSKCTIRSGKESYTFTLVIVEKTETDKDGKEEKVHVLYATNLPDVVINAPGFDIDELYDKRWDIETHYRKLEELRPKTVSRDHGARTFFFFAAAAMLNMWAMYNHQQKEIDEKAAAERARRAGSGGACEPAPEPAPRGECSDAVGGSAECEPGPAPGPGADGAEAPADDEVALADEIVRLALKVQKRPKRKYYKIQLIFLMDVVAKFRESILSWRYLRHRISRRIEAFLELAGVS